MALPCGKGPRLHVLGSKHAVHNGTAEGRHHTEADEHDRGNQHLPSVLHQVDANDSQERSKAQYDPRVVAAHGHVLRAGGGSKADRQDEDGRR